MRANKPTLNLGNMKALWVNISQIQIIGELPNLDGAKEEVCSLGAPGSIVIIRSPGVLNG